MDVYVDTNDTGACILTEKINCNILTTSNIYTDTETGGTGLIPPGMSAGPNKTHTMNACSMYVFKSFQDLLVYVRRVRMARDRIPFFQVNRRLEEQRLSKHVDVDQDVPAQKKRKIEKIYIS